MKAIDVTFRSDTRFSRRRRPAAVAGGKAGVAAQRLDRRPRSATASQPALPAVGAFELYVIRTIFLFVAFGIFQALLR